MTKNYLITGGAGNLACQLTFDLVERGHRVILLDIVEQPIAPTAAGCQYERADVTRPEHIDKLLRRYEPDAIIHFASVLSGQSEADRPRAWRVNMEGTFALLEAAIRHGVTRFFFPSSLAAYGAPLPCPVPEDYPQWPAGFYGVTKVAIERLGHYYWSHHGLDFRALRLPIVVSSYAPPGAVSAYASRAFVEAVRHGQFTFKARPQARPSMLYVKDARRAIMQLLEVDASHLSRRVYNIQALAPTAQQLADAIQARVPQAELIFDVDLQIADLIETWPIALDDSSARCDWNWQPRYDLDAMAEDFIKEIGHEPADAPGLRAVD